LVPEDATFIAYADVGTLMASSMRDHLRSMLSAAPAAGRSFEAETGITLDKDLERILVCQAPGVEGGSLGLVVARGLFDQGKIEALMREHGATVESYRGRRLLVAEPGIHANSGVAKSAALETVALVFLEPGLVALGSTQLVRGAIDRKDGGANVTRNAEVMGVLRSLRDEHLWAIGRFDELRARTALPALVAGKLPPIDWLTVSGRVNGGIQGVLSAEARDDVSAAALRDVVRGFIALAKLQTAARPEAKPLLDSLELTGTGRRVGVAFEASAEMFDWLGRSVRDRADSQLGR
jgi:hypothetical protein